jgi:transformation/transcription domain-associated protein
VHTSDYERFLKLFCPIILKILKEGKPSFQPGSLEQKLRSLCLEILNRLPNNETLRPYVSEILGLVLDLIKTENEENVLICIRIIIDLHKNYRGTLETPAQQFLEFVLNLYVELNNTVTKMFSEGPSPPPSETTPTCK